jgi:pimeloyl-ACP methyl ester carboxylesterase
LSRTEQGGIAYFELGTGPVAVFRHGFPLNSFQWRGVIPLPADIRVGRHRPRPRHWLALAELTGCTRILKIKKGQSN